MGQIIYIVIVVAITAGLFNGVVNKDKIVDNRKSKRRARVKKVRTKFSNFNNDTKPE